MTPCRIRFWKIALAGLFVLTSIVFSGRLQATADHLTGEEVREAAKRPYANDLGPDGIDVSTYPRDMQRAYELFARNCSKCHTLARPINSQWVSPVFWEQYVKRMWHKPGTEINGVEARQIWEFLVYDSQARKLDRREEFEASRRALLEAFKQKYPARYQELYGGLEDEAAKLW